MRLKFFCNHTYRATGVNYGENMLGDRIWAVYFECSECLKVKLHKGYGSEASARTALARFRRTHGQ